MSTRINVSVDRGGLLQRNRQQTTANRQAALDAEQQQRVQQQAEAQRQQRLQQETAARGNASRPSFVREEPAANLKPINADFYVIEYGFSSGRDLDTRTYLRDPISEELLGPVGWCKDEQIPTGGEDHPVVWGGDNTGTGVEAVLFDKPAYKKLYPGSKTAILSLNAFWYNIPGIKVTISVKGYLRGTMEKTGFSWVNPTATRTWNKYDKLTSTAVITNVDECIDGDFISYLKIAIDTGRITYAASL